MREIPAIFYAGRGWACIVALAVVRCCQQSTWRKVRCLVGLLPAYLHPSEKLQVLLCYFMLCCQNVETAR
jgi:hypothetical protein